jgi:hypothetical protein
LSELETKEVIKKKSGKAYNEITKYIETLKNLKNYATTSDDELSDTEAEAYLLEQELAIQQEEEEEEKEEKEEIAIQQEKEIVANLARPIKHSKELKEELVQSKPTNMNVESVNGSIDFQEIITVSQEDTKFTEWQASLSSVEMQQIIRDHYNAHIL